MYRCGNPVILNILKVFYKLKVLIKKYNRVGSPGSFPMGNKNWLKFHVLGFL
jgi:hypothetical protein